MSSAENQQQDSDGVWRAAIPLPFYTSRLSWRGRRHVFVCECGAEWLSEAAYRVHYRSRHLCICPSHASNRGECAIHDELGRVREGVLPERDAVRREFGGGA